MSRVFDVAVVGVSSLVGEALVNLLAERAFPVGKLHPLDDVDQAGGRVEFKGSHLRVADVARFDFSQVQLAFFCAPAAVAEVQVPRATAAGCTVIDDSGLFRMEPDVPLVVAEVNPEALATASARRIVANPNAWYKDQTGQPVADGFSYSSDANMRWVTDEDLRAMISEKATEWQSAS